MLYSGCQLRIKPFSTLLQLCTLIPFRAFKALWVFCLFIRLCEFVFFIFFFQKYQNFLFLRQ